MGRSPCCDEIHVKKGPWTPEEDKKLVEYVGLHGHRSWRNVPKNAGLNRCGKSCRLRWTNYLRPGIKRGKFSEEEQRQIIHLHSLLGNKWSKISTYLPGRTDNEIKNYWNTSLKKKLLSVGVDPVTHRQIIATDLDRVLSSFSALLASNYASPANAVQADAAQYLASLQVLQNLVRFMNSEDAINQLVSAFLGTTQVSDLLQVNRQLHGHINDSLSLLGLEDSRNPHNIFRDQVATQSTSDIRMESNSPVLSNSCDMSSAHSSPFQDWQGLNLEEINDEDFSWKDILERVMIDNSRN